MKKNLPERYAYPACFMPYQDDGDYWIVRFPDLDGCMTNAETLEETIEQAHNILEDYMALLERKRRFIHTRKRAWRAFNLFMMRARRPRSILQTNSALNTQHSSLHSRRVDKTTLTLERGGHAIPKPTPHEKVKAKKDEIVQLVVVPMASARRRWDESAVKKTLTLPRWLAEMGQQAGFNFSQILQEGLRERLNIQ